MAERVCCSQAQTESAEDCFEPCDRIANCSTQYWPEFRDNELESWSTTELYQECARRFVQIIKRFLDMGYSFLEDGYKIEMTWLRMMSICTSAMLMSYYVARRLRPTNGHRSYPLATWQPCTTTTRLLPPPAPSSIFTPQNQGYPVTATTASAPAPKIYLHIDERTISRLRKSRHQ